MVSIAISNRVGKIGIGILAVGIALLIYYAINVAGIVHILPEFNLPIVIAGITLTGAGIALTVLSRKAGIEAKKTQ